MCCEYFFGQQWMFLAQTIKLYQASSTQTGLVGGINALLVLEPLRGIFLTIRKIQNTTRQYNQTRCCQNDHVHCINRTLSLFVPLPLSTNKWSSICPSTSCRLTSDRKSMTTMSTDTKARCLMRRAFWENSASPSER